MRGVGRETPPDRIVHVMTDGTEMPDAIEAKVVEEYLKRKIPVPAKQLSAGASSSDEIDARKG